MTTDLILGTAGHIDHGKTSLIKALTGVDTDRLPEEKRRGITIDLGFAELNVEGFRLGIVDVPGHERFVRNMLCGATGMDLAMLVVAADESVKQQTLEHLDILRLLNLRAGVIALTKCDVVEADWLALVGDDVRRLVAGTFLAEAPIVPTSVIDGTGLERLRAALAAAARRAVAATGHAAAESPFRMAIDRAFTIAGHGTVVTGSVSSGAARIGETLAIEPGGREVRVRGLHNHDRLVEEVRRGQRAAINLAGVHHEEIGRGQELASPGHLVPGRLITARITLLESARHGLKSRSRVRVHLGTAELVASVLLWGTPRVEPGGEAICQLFLAEPAVATWNQPVVLRSESPVATIGGGRVLVPTAEKIRRPSEADVAMAQSLESGDPAERASAALYFSGLRPWKPDDLARTAGIDDVQAAASTLRHRGELVEIVASPTRTLSIHRRVLEELCRRIETVLRRMHAAAPLRSMLDRGQLAVPFAYLKDPAILDTALAAMKARGKVRLGEKGVALAGCGPRLSTGEQTLLEDMVARFRRAGFQPPSLAECQEAAARNRDSVPHLAALAAAEGRLVRISNDFFLHAESEARLRVLLAERMKNDGGLTVSQIREILATSRKYAVPICEYLDRIGFTRRQGDLRVLAEEA
jgi:selenocysteine-specific elongation factor